MEMIKEGIGATLFLIDPIRFTRTGAHRHYAKWRVEKCDYFFLFFFFLVASILHFFFLHLRIKKKSNARVNVFSLGDGWLLSVTLESNLEVRIVLLWLSSKLIKRRDPKV